MCHPAWRQNVRKDPSLPSFFYVSSFEKKKEHKLRIDLAQSHPTVNGFYRTAAPENSNEGKVLPKGKLFSKRFDTGGQ